MIQHRLIASVSNLLLLLCFFAISPMEAVWTLPSVPISSLNSSDPEIGIDSSGNAVAVWQESNGTNTIIMGATLPFNGRWSKPVSLSLSGQNATAPQVAVDPNGNAIAVWVRSNGINAIIQSATLAFKATSWIPTDDISLPGKDALVPQVAVDQNGNAVAVWQRIDDITNRKVIQGATLAFGSFFWIPTTDLSSNTEDTFVPQVSIDGSGNAVAVWTNVTNQQIQAATLNFGSPIWTPAQDISSGLANEPQVAMNASGYAIATWERLDATTGNVVIESAILQCGGGWTLPMIVSGTMGFSQQSDVAVDPSGNAVAVWLNTSLPFTNILIQTATLPKAASSWSPVTTLTTSGSSFDPRVIVDAAGNAIAIWDNNDETNVSIQSSVLPFGGSWTLPATDLEAVGEDAGSDAAFPKIAMTPSGYAVAVWKNLAATTIDSAIWLPAPIVTKVTPNGGRPTGGNSIRIDGKNFINVTDVKFGSISAPNFTIVSPFRISAIAPAGSPSILDVTVTTSAGTSSTTPHDNYTYRNHP